MTKPYLVFMCSEGSYEDIFELVDPIKSYIRGVCALIHDGDENSKEANYLLKINNELGAGNIIFGDYVKRHDHSRNRILYETGIKDGDYLISLDSLERVALDFAKNINHLIESMEKGQIDILSYYYKPYLIKFREDMYYHGNPHEGLLADNELRRVEFNQYEADESKVRINMRPIKRANQPFHWVGHYARYYLAPASNQCLLGLDNHPERAKIFNERQQNRREFLNYLDKNNISRDIWVIQRHWVCQGISEKMRKFISGEKILSDFYRLHFLDDKTVVDNHDLNDTYKFL